MPEGLLTDRLETIKAGRGQLVVYPLHYQQITMLQASVNVYIIGRSFLLTTVADAASEINGNSLPRGNRL